MIEHIRVPISVL